MVGAHEDTEPVVERVMIEIKRNRYFTRTLGATKRANVKVGKV